MKQYSNDDRRDPYIVTWLEIFIMFGMGLVWLGGFSYIALKLTGLL